VKDRDEQPVSCSHHHGIRKRFPKKFKTKPRASDSAGRVVGHPSGRPSQPERTAPNQEARRGQGWRRAMAAPLARLPLEVRHLWRRGGLALISSSPGSALRCGCHSRVPYCRFLQFGVREATRLSRCSLGAIRRSDCAVRFRVSDTSRGT